MLDDFIGNIKNGFNVANTTRKIVFKNRSLFAYPVASAVISILVAVLIFAAAFGIYVFGHMQSLDVHVVEFMSFVVAVIAYFIVFFIGTYFTIAMLIAFREYGNGKGITMGDALGRASQYRRQILEWSAFYIALHSNSYNNTRCGGHHKGCIIKIRVYRQYNKQLHNRRCEPYFCGGGSILIAGNT